MPTVISVEHLSKSYRLGQINTGTFTYDLQLWWAKLRGKPNPFLTIGETDESHRDGELLWALRGVSFTVEPTSWIRYNFIVENDRKGTGGMEDLLKRITFDQNVLHGKPVIRGLRISVEMILELLAKGASRQEILEDYPDLEPADIQAALYYAQHLVAGEVVYDRLSA